MNILKVTGASCNLKCMSSIVNLTHPDIQALNNAVAAAFGCPVAKVYSVADTYPKKMAVFVLVQFQGYKACDVARPYSINCLFVPTVVKEITEAYAKSEMVRYSVHQILNAIEDVAV